jgi:hypothetical protein
MKTINIIFALLITLSLFANDDNWDNDFYLKNLHPDHTTEICTDTVTTNCIQPTDVLRFNETAKASFKQLITEYGLAIAPSFIQPAETLGSKGYELGVNYSFAKIGQTNICDESGNCGTPWVGTYGGANPGSLNLVTIEARKGLPASFELGGRVSYIFASHLFIFGVSGKFAILESVGYAPDIAIRATYTSLFGSKEVSIDVMTLDAIIGYDFSLAGMMAIYPYFAYSLTKITGNSNEVLINSKASPFTCSTNTDYCDYENSDTYNNRVDSFDEFNKTSHRFAFGVRLHNAAFVLTPELILSTDKVWGINTKIGFDF